MEMPQIVRQCVPHIVQLEPVGRRDQHISLGNIGSNRADGAPAASPAFMHYSVFCKLVDQLPRTTELQLHGGGEPLLHLHFFDMVAYAVQRGITVSTTSNLRVLTEGRALECVESGLHVMNVAIDSVRVEASEMPGARSRLGRVLRNLHRLERAKESRSSALPEIRLAVVATRSNLVELPDLIRLAREEGIEKVLVEHAGAPHQSLLHEDPHKVVHYFALTHAIARQLGINLHLPNPTPSEATADGPERARNRPSIDSYVGFDGDSSHAAPRPPESTTGPT